MVVESKTKLTASKYRGVGDNSLIIYLRLNIADGLVPVTSAIGSKSIDQRFDYYNGD